jgi:hypothetical protein
MSKYTVVPVMVFQLVFAEFSFDTRDGFEGIPVRIKTMSEGQNLSVKKLKYSRY